MTLTSESSLTPGSVGVLTPSATLEWSENRFLRDHQEVQILSGSLHYFRVHPDQWRDRLQRLRDLGLNTVDTYIPWNFHQTSETSAPDFTGWRDVESFLRIAADVGLGAIVRPGPYICAEWSNGGLPTWLTGRAIALRSSDERFLRPVSEWFAHLLPRIAALQAVNGGPVIAVQVENEFGSFGDDHRYTATIASELRSGGITELLFTADGPTDVMLEGGAVSGVLAGLTLGSRPAEARALARRRRPGEPFWVAEYWNGWFDHWGHPHHVRHPESASSTLSGIVADGGNVSLYMAHGGSNFGLWAGANRVDGELRPTVTSYDSDAPIAEDGTLTPKFYAMRDVLGAEEPVVSRQPRMITPLSVPTIDGATLTQAFDLLAGPATSVGPTVSFEQLGVDSGLLRLRADVVLPASDVELVFPLVADRVMIRVDDEPLGDVVATGSVTAHGTGASARIDLVVENLGRVNYGWSVGEFKGLIAPMLVERRAVQEWEASHIDIAGATPAGLEMIAAPGATGTAGAASATFRIDEPLDAHLALPGFSRGFAWINGFLLGRYWSIGPQQTLYVPAPLLRAGRNTVVVLELEQRGRRIELRDVPELGPEEEYIEQF